MADEQFTEEDVQLVLSALVGDTSDWPAAVRDNYRESAAEVLRALAEAGRLLPPDMEIAEEWGVWLSESPGVPAGPGNDTYDGEAEARQFAGWFKEHGWAEAYPVRRTRARTPWVPVGTTEEPTDGRD